MRSSILSSLFSVLPTVNGQNQLPLGTIESSSLTPNSILHSTRAYWMRSANAALSTLSRPCPFAAFGTVIVNHTAASIASGDLGELVCMGVNENAQTGNPTLHGEMAAITNCTKMLTDADGRYKLSAEQAKDAFLDLSLYTNAESCPMCASAIRWSGFKEYIYGTSIDTLVLHGSYHRLFFHQSTFYIMSAYFQLPRRADFVWT